ncbi:MAG: hypothetical protein PHX04_02845 [Bacilli bacterium]|nr:hypothetical protein [Bacilli bacterium]
MSLPEIFKNKINENIENSQHTFYSANQESRNVFDTFPVDAIIETNNRSFITKIVGKTDNYLITNNREVIYINNCTSIKKL